MGGKAFPDTVGINQEEAKELLEHCTMRTGLYLEPVGSYSKKASMGDLDLMVLFSEFDPGSLPESWQARRIGKHLVTCRVPINEGDAYAQVDFLPVVSFGWGEFSYYSDGSEESGLLPQLLRACTLTLEETGVDQLQWDGDELLVRCGRTFDQSDGIRRIYQTKMGKRGFLKNLKSIDRATYLRDYPTFNPPDVAPITDPKAAKLLLFGDETADTSSAAAAWWLVLNSYTSNRIRRIQKQLVSRGFDLETLGMDGTPNGSNEEAWAPLDGDGDVMA